MKKTGMILSLLLLFFLATACSSAKTSKKSSFKYSINRSKHEKKSKRHTGPIAFIKQYSGEVKITRNGQILIPHINMTLFSKTYIRVTEDALITLIMYGGQQVSFVGRMYFKLVVGGIMGLDKKTIAFLKEKNPDIDRSDSAASR